jgi:hypothetical protein
MNAHISVSFSFVFAWDKFLHPFTIPCIIILEISFLERFENCFGFGFLQYWKKGHYNLNFTFCFWTTLHLFCFWDRLSLTLPRLFQIHDHYVFTSLAAGISGMHHNTWLSIIF